MSICIDLLITAMSVNLVWGLQMGSKSKSLVVTAFTLRLFVTPVTIIRLVSLSAVRPDDFSFTYTLPEAMTQLEMYCSLIATTLPCLRLFLTAWNTSFMDIRLEEIDNDAYRERESSHMPDFHHSNPLTISIRRNNDERLWKQRLCHPLGRLLEESRIFRASRNLGGQFRAIESIRRDRDSRARRRRGERKFGKRDCGEADNRCERWQAALSK